MTQKEKAKELFNKFNFIYSYDGLGIMDDEFTNDDRKECALIAVDEIIKTLKDNDLYIGGETNIDDIIRFWQEVKQEIEKL